MTWYKVDDGIHSHPKFLDVSLAAVGLWTMCGAWCSAYLTDGQITRRQVQRLGGDDTLAAELVDAGLWRETGDGYVFHDWADYQGSSPLARGAPAGHRHPGRLRGLIPARAGSTLMATSPPWMTWAHPRSRGEHGDPSTHTAQS